VSTDLSKATDLISHEVAWALWSGILERDDVLTRQEKEAVILALGPQVLVFPGEHETIVG